jgi:hypothetical protein
MSRLAIVLVIGVLGLAACGDDDEPTTTQDVQPALGPTGPTGPTGNAGQQQQGDGDEDQNGGGGQGSNANPPPDQSAGGGGGAGSSSASCEAGYDPCVPPFPPDVDCPDVGGPISVTGSDPHGLDADNDGVACET